MPIRVLVVDDSAFFRQQIVSLLKSDKQFEVAGEASDGRDAIVKVAKLKPDVVTMDYEMPVMDGITAVKEIMKATPTPVLMFSSMTTKGAKITLDALDAGALDFIPKFRDQISGSQRIQLKELLFQKLRAVTYRHANKSRVTNTPLKSDGVKKNPSGFPSLPITPQLLLIGTSTGGPVALQKILTQLPSNFPVPILLIQHMPAAFTTTFSERLNGLCQLQVREAKDGDTFCAGEVLLAPGGKQMMISTRNKIKIIEGDARLNYRPSVDLTFGTAAKIYPGKVLALVLTGMGADGREGARVLKQSKSQVWVQDSASCVIDGMPAAIRNSGLADEVLPIDSISSALINAFMR